MSLVKKTKTALDESRMLMLGAQILLGFQFQAPFQNAFDRLTSRQKLLEIAALCIMLVVIGLLVTPSARHRIVDEGKATPEINVFITGIAYPTLILFALAMALNLHVIGVQIGGLATGWTAAIAGFFVALGLWFGPLLLERPARGPTMTQERTPTSAKIDYALTEARVILPGAQAMLGFQFAIVLTTGFAELPGGLKAVHGAAIVFIVLATILLMAPAVYHRIVHDGEDAPKVYRVASRLILAATVFLALGLTADLYMVASKITHSDLAAAVLAALSAVCLFGLWHCWPIVTALMKAK